MFRAFGWASRFPGWGEELEASPRGETVGGGCERTLIGLDDRRGVTAAQALLRPRPVELRLLEDAPRRRRRRWLPW